MELFPQFALPPHTRRALNAPLTGTLAQMLTGMASLPQRALQSAGELQRGGDYDPAPVMSIAELMTGFPGVPRGALGSSMKNLPGNPALTGEIMGPAKSTTALAGIDRLQQARLGPMIEHLQKLGATPEQIRTFTPQEAYNFISSRIVGGQ